MTKEEKTLVEEFLSDGDVFHVNAGGSLGLRIGRNFDLGEAGIFVGDDFIGYKNLEDEEMEELIGTVHEEIDWELFCRNLMNDYGEEILEALRKENHGRIQRKRKKTCIAHFGT